MSQEVPNSYSKVIFKQVDDSKAKEMVNSYRFKSPSPQKYKVWSPEISQEERFKKKREREDEYINLYNQNERPILVIKKKQAYKGIQNIDIVNDNEEKESYYKISENTNIIEDVNEELKAQKEFIRKQTLIHNKNLKGEDDENALYKIQGIEFLPEGFLELDPLLYRDEFEFESKVHERFFSDEQRKIKALRRKQYEQKNYNKMRDVTIYLLDERKDKIIEYLEKWYFKHKRRMNKKEIVYVANLLKCDATTMKNLQDLFLEKKKFLNTKRLREYLTKHGKLKNDQVVVPSSLKRYFIQNTDPYSHIGPKVYNIDYSPSKKIINENLKKTFSQRITNNNQKSSQSKSKNKQLSNNSKNEQLSNNSNNERVYNNSNNERVYKNSNNERVYNNSNNERVYNNSNNERVYNNSNNERVYHNSNDERVYNNSNDERAYHNSNNERGYNNSNNEKKNNNSNNSNQQTYYNNYRNQDLNQFSNTTPVFTNSSQYHPNQLFSNTSGHIVNSNSDYKKSDSSSNKKSLGLIKTSTQEDSSSFYKNQYEDDDLRLYFDSEVNKILEKIKRSDYMEDCNVEIGKEKKIMNCKYVLGQTNNSQKLIIDYTKRIISNNRVNISEKNISKTKDASEHTRKTKKTANLEEIAYDVLNERNLRPDLKITNELLKKHTLTRNSPEMERYPEMDTFGGEKIIQANPKILHSEVDEMGNVQITHENTEKPFIAAETNPKRVTIVKSNKNGDTTVIQKLEPILVGNEYFYQNIIDTTKDGKRNVSLITKTDRGEIVDIFEIDPDFITDNYQNEVYNEPAKFDGDKKITVVVNNDKGKAVSIQNLRPSISCIFADTQLDKQLYQGNFRKSQILNIKKETGIKRIHSLNPILVSGRNYHQKIVEDIQNDGKRKITIHTINEKGKIVYEEEIEQIDPSKSFFTQIDSDFINDNGNRETSILTKNDQGEIIVSHVIKTKLSKKTDQFYSKLNRGYRNTTMNTKRLKDKTIRSHTLKPIVVGKDYFHQTVEETINKEGKRSMTIITKDQLGQVIQEEKTNNHFMGNGYNTEIIQDTIEKDGKRKITVATKNDRGETICINTVRPTINSVLGENFFADFVQKSRGKSCISQNFSVQDKKITVHALRPTLMGNQYFQQFINEEEDGLRNKKITIVTKSQDGSVVSNLQVSSRGLIGREFVTEIVKAEVDGNREQVLTVSTKNEKGEEILSQKIKPVFQSVLGENCFEEFDKKSNGRKSIVNTLRHNGSVIRSQTLRPTTIGNKHYQPIINEVIDQSGKKSCVVMTRNDNGDLIDIKEIDPDQKIGTYCYADVEQREDRGITIVIRNQEGEEIATQRIQEETAISNFPEGEGSLDNFENSAISKLTFSKKNNNSVVSHILKPTLVGDEYFQQIIEEVFDVGGEKKFTIITKDLDGRVLERKSMSNDMAGLNYSTQITNDFINDKGVRKVTVETRNDRGQTVHLMRYEPKKEDMAEVFFDTQEILEMDVNHVEVLRSDDGGVIKRSTIRPTVIGNNFYKHVIEEIITDFGDRKITLITLDIEDKEIDRKEINSLFAGENYKAEISEEKMEKDGNRMSTLEITNEKGLVLASQKFLCETATDQHEYYFSDFADIFDNSGKRQSTIATKKSRGSIFRTHSLRPTLVGNKYYQQTVNEFIEDNTQNAVIVTSDENGNIIATQKLDAHLMGEFYTNEITEDKINEEGERYIMFEMKNDRGETISIKSFRPSLNEYLHDDYFDNIIEEIVDKEGNKLIHVFDNDHLNNKPRLTQRNITKFRKTALTPILEEDEEDSLDGNGRIKDKNKRNQTIAENKNKYFSDLIQQYDLINKYRGSSNTINKTIEELNNKISIHYEEGNQIEPEGYKNEEEGHLGVDFVLREKKPTIRPDAKSIKEKKLSEKSISNKKIKKVKNITGKNFKDMTKNKEEPVKVSLSLKNIIERESMINENKQTIHNSEPLIDKSDSKIDQLEKKKSIRDSNLIDSEEDYKTNEVNEEHDTNDHLYQINKQYQEITNNIKVSEFVEEIDDEQFLLIEKSKRLKGYLDDYINTIHASKIKKDKSKKNKKLTKNEILLRRTIEEVFKREKEKLSDEITNKFKREMKKGKINHQDDLMDEFYEFCKNKLPNDDRYKESIMFVSLFYYFLEKKKILN